MPVSAWLLQCRRCDLSWATVSKHEMVECLTHQWEDWSCDQLTELTATEILSNLLQTGSSPSPKSLLSILSQMEMRKKNPTDL